MSQANQLGFCGGDEVSALVLDTGTSWTRCGYAGGDHPAAVVPSLVGAGAPGHGALDAAAAAGDSAAQGGGVRRRRRPRPGLRAADPGDAPRAGEELIAPYEHALPSNIAALEALWDNVFHNVLRCDPTEHAVLVTEASHGIKRRGVEWSCGWGEGVGFLFDFFLTELIRGDLSVAGDWFYFSR
jgi:actin-related protein